MRREHQDGECFRRRDSTYVEDFDRQPTVSIDSYQMDNVDYHI